MRIAFVINSYPPRLGGLELHIQNLAHGLAGRGHDVHVLTIDAQPDRRQEGPNDRVNVLTGQSHWPIADIISFPSIGATSAVSKYLRSHQIDLVSTHTRFFPMSLVGHRAARRLGLPRIHTEHGSTFVTHPSPVIVAGARTVDETMGRLVLRGADMVLGVSRQATEFATHLGAHDARVFYNAITPPDPDASFVDRPEHLVFAARMIRAKGWMTFLDIVAQLRAAGRGVTGIMLGSGSELALARQYRDERGLRGVVEIPGRVPGEVARQELRGATLVNPSTSAEGLQTVLLEAVAERGRVVTYDVPGADELKEAGAPVLVTQHKDPQELFTLVSSVLDQPPSLASAALITPWTWPSRVEQYERYAEELLFS